MQDKYINHYLAVIFHKWFMALAKTTGDSPFRAVIQNHVYTQDPENPSKVRIQSFIEALRTFIKQAEAMDDPDPPPTIFETGINAETEAKIAELKAEAIAKLKAKQEAEKQAKDDAAALHLKNQLGVWGVKHIVPSEEFVKATDKPIQAQKDSPFADL